MKMKNNRNKIVDEKDKCNEKIDIWRIKEIKVIKIKLMMKNKKCNEDQREDKDEY